MQLNKTLIESMNRWIAMFISTGAHSNSNNSFGYKMRKNINNILSFYSKL